MGDSYRTLHRAFSRKPSKFGWVIEGKLAASGRLMSKSQLAWCVKHGIKSVVTIRELPLESKWFAADKQKDPDNVISYKHIEVKDYGAPPIEELHYAVNYIDDEISKDRPVVVHCNGGRGRTGTLLAAYFMNKEGLTAKQALERVREIRGRAPRREKQLKALSDYENYLLANKN